MIACDSLVPNRSASRRPIPALCPMRSPRRSAPAAPAARGDDNSSPRLDAPRSAHLPPEFDPAAETEKQAQKAQASTILTRRSTAFPQLRLVSRWHPSWRSFSLIARTRT